jgi:hypothetical protein
MELVQVYFLVLANNCHLHTQQQDKSLRHFDFESTAGETLAIRILVV